MYRNVTHVALDLETVGTKPGCAILSIGAKIAGTPDGIGEFYRKISPDSSRVAAFFFDERTMDWWMDQDAVARDEAFSGTLPVTTVLNQFADFLYSSCPELKLWGNGSMFDNAILAAAYDKMGLAIPWSYKADMCLRTLRAIPGVPACPQFIGTKHNALDDAKCQAAHLALILDHLAALEKGAHG